MRDYTVSWPDRIWSALSYLTAGWLGLLYCIILYFYKKNVSNFVRFNVIQSIFFALLYFVLSMVLGLVFSLFSHIPIIQILVSWVQLTFFRPILFGFSLLQLIIDGFLLYFVIMTLSGRKPIIYGLSKILGNR